MTPHLKEFCPNREQPKVNAMMLHIDNLEYLRQAESKSIDLAIVDPPYGLGKKLTHGGGKLGRFRKDLHPEGGATWDVKPTQEYWRHLFRVTKNQIIWGGNYFKLPPHRCTVVWDKYQVLDNFSAVEIAWTSFDKPAKLFRTRQAGFVSEKKIHPTQKPVELYRYLLHKFAQPGDKILDTHMGSGSSAIAAIQMGFYYIGLEKDPVYFREAIERIRINTAQKNIFQ